MLKVSSVICIFLGLYILLYLLQNFFLIRDSAHNYKQNMLLVNV